jgi:hypothetical protein
LFYCYKRDRSAYAFRINVVHELLKERNNRLVKISREANLASHELAKQAVNGVTNLWLGESIPEVGLVIANDCNPVST